ncbi:MAG: phage holin family protein [Bacteriovorax sp.]|nr:phage holin family protein [Bacteriovorax sp.]
MTHLFYVWFLTSLVLLITSFIVPGFQVTGFGVALIASVLIGILNIFLRPILLFLTFPINLLTLGLFTFVVNAIVLKITAFIIKGFEIKTWTAAIIGAVLIAIIQALIFLVF